MSWKGLTKTVTRVRQATSHAIWASTPANISDQAPQTFKQRFNLVCILQAFLEALPSTRPLPSEIEHR